MLAGMHRENQAALAPALDAAPGPTRRPRVLVVGPLPPPLGGGQLLLEMLVRSSLARDFELDVVDTSKGVLRWAVERPSWRTPLYFARDIGRLVPALLRLQPEVVVVHASGSLSFVRDWIFMLAARIRGARVVCHYHGTLHTRFPSTLTPAGRFFGRAMMAAADRVIVVAPGYRDRFAAAWGRDDVAWSPNVADVAQIQAASGKPNPWLAPGERGVLFVGRLSETKGIWDLIEAMPSVVTRHPEVRFLLVGVAETEAQEPVLRAAVAERGLEARVRFLGSLDAPEKALAYACASVFVSPSWTEAFPLVIPEAMAAGLPMVLTAVGAIPDLVHDGEDGFLVPPRDPAALADRVNRLLDDEALRARVAAHVRERAPREFDVEVGAKSVRCVIDGLLTRPRVAADPGATPSGPPPGAPRWPPDTGLVYWLVALALFGGGGVLFGEQELALLVAMSGLFVAAQAADLEPRWAGLYRALAWVVPVATAAVFASIAVLIFQADLGIGLKSILLGSAGASAAACLAAGLPPFADGLARLLLGADPPSRSLRLSAQLVFAGLLLAIPGWFALRDVLSDESPSLIEQLSLGSGLLGYVLLALAAVGFMVRRNLRATLDRLGLKALRLRDGGTIVAGVAGLLLLNHGADWFQQRALPDLWKSDQAFNEALAGGLSGAQAVLLGMSAGIGEEITMRGALQPRLGLTLTALLFASLHVQYSWYGMAVIFVLGLVLGVIRRRTSTTAAMAVHVIYDIVAILTT
jgi:glycosyltransferase involved in cell wall biosynthesis